MIAAKAFVVFAGIAWLYWFVWMLVVAIPEMRKMVAKEQERTKRMEAKTEQMKRDFAARYGEEALRQALKRAHST